LLSSGSVFPAFLHLSIALALLAGGARMLWLFLSPVPRAMPKAVKRRRFLTIGKFAPLLLVFGCGAVTGFIMVLLWMKSAPHNWWNIFPFLAVYALGIAGVGALLSGIAVQSTLVDAYRGFDPDADTGNFQRDLDGAFVFAFAVIMLAAMSFRWLPDFTWSTATLEDVDRHKFAIRGALYLAAFAAVLRAYYTARNTAPEANKGLRYLAAWSGALLFIVLDGTIKGLLPRDYDVARYLKDRDDPVSLLGLTPPLAPPPDLWHGELVALLGLSLVATMSVTTLVDLVARRGLTTIYIPTRIWPGGLFACLAFLSTGAYARHDLPPNAAIDWISEVAMPLMIGMALLRTFPLLLDYSKKGWGFGVRIAARSLLAQILLFILLSSLAAALLSAISLLNKTGFAVLLFASVAAATLGWLRFPAAVPAAKATPAEAS